MASALIQSARVIENSAAVLMARVVNDSGYPILPEEVESITCKVWDAEEATLVTTVALSPDVNVLPDPIVTPAWTVDATGFNFVADMPGTCWPNGGRTYQVEIKFNTVLDEYDSGNPFYICWSIQSLNIFSE